MMAALFLPTLIFSDKLINSKFSHGHEMRSFAILWWEQNGLHFGGVHDFQNHHHRHLPARSRSFKHGSKWSQRASKS
ncbi:hypothetical protein [Vibrio vulnificus YJ016]|uniref:Uncharacterized protein n=1 Tax=Vibrio vulnificus (strain YJ016) TaxID=196600 RepID=Q7MEY2_VIBVY|nr:hypothetical protein [Vibrio vulnificus YJ016]